MAFTPTQAGSFRHPLEIRKPVSVNDAYGGATTRATLFAKVRGAIIPHMSKEYVVENKVVTISRFTIRIRYIDGIDTTMHVYNPVNSKTYEILGIRNIEERNRFLDLTRRTRVSSASYMPPVQLNRFDER